MTSKNNKLDLDEIRSRVKQKRLDYIEYDFSRKKNDTLKTFFDLAQEYDTLPDLYRICVTVPLESFGVDSRLYLFNDEIGIFEMVCDSKQGVYDPCPSAPDYVHKSRKPYEKGKSYLVPVFSKTSLHGNDVSQPPDSVVIGMLEVYPLQKLRESDKFFFSKYTNRIGYNLRKKILAQQNIKHLQFIQSLVSDIEHNVIVPNMYYRHLFNHLKKKIGKLASLSETIEQYKSQATGEQDGMCRIVIDQISEIKQGLLGAYEEIDKHHINLSVFLESLFRRDHFEKGRFVLQQKVCKLESEIIEPQLEHFKKRFQFRGIVVEKPVDMLDDEFKIMVDFGLFSQVYANLFSNALKYTEEVTGCDGKPRKAMAYGRKIIDHYFEHGCHGVKLNVFTTGCNLDPQISEKVFTDGFMVKRDISDLDSSGHGLSFVKYVVELHGGTVGYEATEQGNNFYFILPLIAG